MARPFLLLAAINGFLTVALGAFGAHVLKTRLEPELFTIYQTGVHYHGLHSVALLGVALLALQLPHSRPLRSAGVLFVTGMLLFSGSLYLLAITGIRPLGAVTPFGGVSFLAGWLLLGWVGWRDFPDKK